MKFGRYWIVAWMHRRIGFVFAVFFLLGLFFLVGVRAEIACGNGICEGPRLGGTENPCTCEQDCGKCEASPYEVCRRYVCDFNNVCQVSTVPNCCGNNKCESIENYGNCPGDCLPESLDFVMVSPLEGETFARNQKGLISTQLSSAGRELLGAVVHAVGFFGAVRLFNDGKHGDGTNLDNVYANYFTVPVSTEEGNQLVTVSAVFREKVTGEIELMVPVKAELKQDISVPVSIFLGENLVVSGTVLRGTVPVEMEFDLNVINPFGVLLEKKGVVTDASGSFLYSFRTSLIDPAGEWQIHAQGMDANQNRLFFSRSVLVANPSQRRFLSLEIVSDKETVEKGDSVTWVATVSDLGILVDNASVELIDPLHSVFPFLFQSNGQYALTYTVPFELGIGDQNFEIRAKRTTGIVVEGFKTVSVSVKGKPFSLELVLPKEKQFNAGDVVSFQVHAEYSFNQPVLDANAHAIIKGQKVLLQSDGSGFYSGEYYLDDPSTGSVSYEIVLEDKYQNRSSVSDRIDVVGVGFAFYARQYLGLFMLLSLVFSALFFLLYRVFLKQSVIRKLEKRKAELMELEKSIQIKYFEENALGRTEYDSLMESYESELKETEKKLKSRKSAPEKGQAKESGAETEKIVPTPAELPVEKPKAAVSSFATAQPEERTAPGTEEAPFSAPRQPETTSRHPLFPTKPEKTKKTISKAKSRKKTVLRNAKKKAALVRPKRNAQPGESP